VAHGHGRAPHDVREHHQEFTQVHRRQRACVTQFRRLDRDIFPAAAEPPELRHTRPLPTVDLRELLVVFADVMRRAAMTVSHHVQLERLSTRERMSQILDRLQQGQFLPFVSFFNVSEGRMGVVVSFLAVMELIKESLIEIVQSEPFGPIHVKARGQDATEIDS